MIYICTCTTVTQTCKLDQYKIKFVKKNKATTINNDFVNSCSYYTYTGCIMFTWYLRFEQIDAL